MLLIMMTINLSLFDQEIEMRNLKMLKVISMFGFGVVDDDG